MYNKSIYVQQEIELSIIVGKIKEGEKLYSLNEICHIFDIGKTTAMKIVRNLEEDNIIYKKRGLGYFIKPFAEKKLKEKYNRLIINKLNEIKKIADILDINITDQLKKLE